MTAHPDLQAEQAYIDHAYECLEAAKRAAADLGSTWDVGAGGTFQARLERDAMWEAAAARLAQLELGDAALCFGRIDTDGTVTGVAGNGHRPPAAATGGNEAGGGCYYIGRVAVSDDQQDPVVVDWRAPVAEPFYRATGSEPMGLLRRRHFASRGRTLLGIDDELFGELTRSLDDLDEHGHRKPVQGYGALISALETARTGRLADIVATIQAEQDEIIRAPMPGVLVVQGGPGTGKTVVALHRAAYLLYTHRFPLEGQGVLVVGPNRLFLNYIEQVLPSLGEAGVEQATLPDLVPEGRVGGADGPTTSRIKGDLRMVRVLRRAVHQRELPLRHDLEVGYGVQHLRLTVDRSRHIVTEARRRFRRHNAARRFVEGEVFAALAQSSRRDELAPEVVRDALRRHPDVREALEWIWPVLTPAELLNDLFGAKGLLRAAGRDLLADDEWLSLHRERHADATEVVWSTDDVPLLDEARALLGPRPRPKGQPVLPADDDPRTYGHIVVDEAQDLSPMQLRMLTRRSLGGSMTIVGDIAQATGAWAHADWDGILELLPDRRPPRRAELSVGYRIPKPIMDVAARVLREAAPGLAPPDSIRTDGDAPRFVRVAPAPPADPAPLGEPGRLFAVDAVVEVPLPGLAEGPATSEPGGSEAGAPAGADAGAGLHRLADAVAEAVRIERAEVDPGSVAVICAPSMVDALGEALDRAGIEHARATRHGLDRPVTLVPVGLVKGLELDAAVVVEPAAIVAEEHQGARALYVALTRSTKRLAVVHARPLPAALHP